MKAKLIANLVITILVSSAAAWLYWELTRDRGKAMITFLIVAPCAAVIVGSCQLASKVDSDRGR